MNEVIEVPTKPHPLIAPLDTSKLKDEKGVKALIKRLLDFHGWYHWPNAAGGIGGAHGLSDRHAIKDGVFLAIEAKFGKNKPTPLQTAHAAQVIANSAFAFCVNEKNINHLAMWLESLEHMIKAQREGRKIPDDHGSRCINAQASLMSLFK